MISPEQQIAPVPMRIAMECHPLTVSPETAIHEAIALMSQAQSSCVLIVEESNLTGIFTERDLVRLIAADSLKEEATIDEVMTRKPIALREDRAQDFLTILNIMGQHHIRHLPVVDERGQLVGLIERSSLRQALQPSDLMQLRRVEEVMNSQVVRASPETPLLQLAKLMAEKSVSCVVITQADADGAIAPLGIITERDILQYQNLGLDFRHTSFDALGMHGKNPSGIAQTVMSTPLLPISGQDSLLRQEITDRQQVEQALVQSERRFRAIFNQTFQFTWLLTPEGLIIEANQTALDFGGLELADIRDKPFWSASWWRNSPKSQIKLREAIARAASGEFMRYEVDVLGADDRIATIDFSLKPVQDETRQVVLLIPEGRDITDRKQAEAALTKAKAELEIKVAQRTAALSEANQQLQQELIERRQAEAALRESEARFRIMADSSPVLLWVSGTDGLCTFFNQPWLEFTGRTLEQELGNGWTENVHPEDFHYCLDIYMTSFHARRPFQIEYRLRRADGEYRWVLDRAIPRSNADGSFAGYIGSCIDISDRKRAEAERAKLIAIIEATPDFISSSSVNGQVLYFNKAARKILGLGENEEIDNFHIPKGHPDWVNDIIQTEGIPTAMRDGSWLGETALLSSDGREVPLSQLIIAHRGTDGKVNMLSTIARDISKQKQIEATLRESERRWRSLLEQVRLVVVGLDRSGKVEYINPFFLELVEYTEAEVKGCDWFATFLPKLDRPQVNKYFWEILERDFKPHYQNTILTKSGEERMIAWNNTRLQDAGGKAIGTMSIGEDITERYALERMKDEFISVVSHELRTPLTAIHGGLNLLSSGLVEPQSDRGKRIIQISAENSDRLVQLVNDILELERLQSSKIKLSKQQVNATDLMNKATEIIQVMANQAGVTISVSPQDIELHADCDRIIQVLTNLLSNAIKFSPKGSTVWLTVQQQSERGECCSHCVNHDGNNSIDSHPYCLLPHCSQPILFEVKDRGCGIPADKLESIFERFHQVDSSDSRRKGGTGLGLAICRSIIEQHGGQIWAESTLGKGSSFNFTLPGREDHHDHQANSSD